MFLSLNLINPMMRKILFLLTFSLTFLLSGAQTSNYWLQSAGIWYPGCVDGTYFYIISYTIACCVENDLKTLRGFITVIR